MKHVVLPAQLAALWAPVGGGPGSAPLVYAPPGMRIVAGPCRAVQVRAWRASDSGRVVKAGGDDGLGNTLSVRTVAIDAP